MLASFWHWLQDVWVWLLAGFAALPVIALGLIRQSRGPLAGADTDAPPAEAGPPPEVIYRGEDPEPETPTKGGTSAQPAGSAGETGLDVEFPHAAPQPRPSWRPPRGPSEDGLRRPSRPTMPLPHHPHDDRRTDVFPAAPPVTAVEPPKPFQAVDIFFGTDRARDGKARGGYGGERAEALSVGQAVVTVPAARKKGSVTRPLTVLGVQLEAEDPAKHFVLQSAEALTQAEFAARLAAQASAAPAFLFVHGYHTSFAGGLYRTAQFAIDCGVKGPVLHYSWPSRDALLAYDYDDGSVRQARPHFLAFLDLVAATTGLKQLNIVAHSKGNDLVLEALAAHPKTRLAKVGQVVLTAPDIDHSVAKEPARKVGAKVKGFTLYACKEDVALWVSGRKAGKQARIGGLMTDGFPFIAPGLDSIDASKCRLRLSEFNHNSVVVDTVLRHDLARLLEAGTRPPNARTPSITPRTCARGDYWYLEPR